MMDEYEKKIDRQFKKYLVIAMASLVVGMGIGSTLNSGHEEQGPRMKEHKDIAAMNTAPGLGGPPLAAGDYKIISRTGVMVTVADSQGKVQHMPLPEKIDVQNFDGPILHIEQDGAASIQGK